VPLSRRPASDVRSLRRGTGGRAARWVIWLAVAALPGPAASAGETRTPTDGERVSYWLDRVLRGPEPTAFAIPNFHLAVLQDAERNLVELGDATVERLADDALRVRVQSQPDTNPWHALLRVLGILGPRRPALARAWAVPALEGAELTLRREALPVLVALRDPADGPAVKAAFARDAQDRVLGPEAIRLLASYGPPWDAIAAREVAERGAADLPDGTSTVWNGLTSVLEGPSSTGGRPEVLAWWALLAETSGPRAPMAFHAGAAGSRSIDPERTAVVSLAHAIPSGTYPAGGARAVLARRGSRSAIASARADLAGRDPELGGIAGKALRADPTEAARKATIEEAGRFAAALAAGDPTGTPAQALVLLDRLSLDPSDAATRATTDLFVALPRVPTWRDPILYAFRTLARRGAEPVDRVAALLQVADVAHVDLALLLILQTKHRAYLPLLEELVARPGFEAWQSRGRRLLALLYANALRSEGGLPLEQVAAFARELRRWVEDPADPSGAGLAGTLLELGPAGEAQVADGLAGRHREMYVEALSHALEHPVGLEVVRALLAPLSDTTPPATRRAVLTAVFYSASAEAAPLLAELVARLPAAAATDVEMVRQIVRWRTATRP